MSNEQQQNQKVNPAKVNEKFTEITTKLNKLFGEESFKGSVKLSGDTAKSIVAEILQERREELEKTVKNEFKVLVAKRVDHEREIKKYREEFEKSVALKQQEYINAANSILSKIDAFEEDTRDFGKSIDDVTGVNGSI